MCLNVARISISEELGRLEAAAATSVRAEGSYASETLIKLGTWGLVRGSGGGILLNKKSLFLKDLATLYFFCW